MQTVNTQSVHTSEEYIDHNQLLVYTIHVESIDKGVWSLEYVESIDKDCRALSWLHFMATIMVVKI